MVGGLDDGSGTRRHSVGCDPRIRSFGDPSRGAGEAPDADSGSGSRGPMVLARVRSEPRSWPAASPDPGGAVRGHGSGREPDHRQSSGGPRDRASVRAPFERRGLRSVPGSPLAQPSGAGAPAPPLTGGLLAADVPLDDAVVSTPMSHDVPMLQMED